MDFLWVSGLEEECQHFLLMGVTDEFDFVTGYVDAGFEHKWPFLRVQIVADVCISNAEKEDAIFLLGGLWTLKIFCWKWMEMMFLPQISEVLQFLMLICRMYLIKNLVI